MSSNSSEAGSPPAGDTHRGNMTGPAHGNSTGAGGGAGGHAGGKGGGDAARLAMFALRQTKNEWTAEYLAASLCGIIAVFIFLHWTRYLGTRSRTKPTPLTRPFVLVSRAIRNFLVRALPGFNSAGHGLLVAVYVAVNLTMLLTNIDTSSPGNESSRLGWVLISNMCFVVFLALKNTPLAYLTSYSYERLNALHQIAGCTTFLLMILHSVIYTIFFYKRDAMHVLQEREQIAGIIAGFGFLSLFLTAMLLRRYSYETFYCMHILSFIVSIICIGFHRHDFKEKAPIITCITGSMWATDRLIRLTRFLINTTNNEATVYPLPNGGTRIILSKKPMRAAPGKHCFVWIPKIRKFEMHPFSIISTQPMEFVVKEYNGFTRDLHAYATANPGAKLRASVEGPYGTFPDPMEYDKIILVAGGSGASYTFGLAVNLLEKMDAESTKNIVFIWTAKTHENLTWFADQLNTLRTHPNAPKVEVSLYVSRAPSSASSSDGNVAAPQPALLRRHSQSSIESPTSPTDPEKALHEHQEKRAVTVLHDIEKDMEKQREQHRSAADNLSNASETAPLRHAVASGRPDTATLVAAAIKSSGASQRVLVAACGPPSLMKTVRNTTAKCIRGDGPGVELHCEQFGW